jgi:hypothetical protein
MQSSPVLRANALGMARNRSPRHPPFRQRWFADEIIITCVRWYLRFKLSYRDLAELVRELGVDVAPSTILRSGLYATSQTSQLTQVGAVCCIAIAIQSLGPHAHRPRSSLSVSVPRTEYKSRKIGAALEIH